MTLFLQHDIYHREHSTLENLERCIANMEKWEIRGKIIHGQCQESFEEPFRKTKLEKSVGKTFFRLYLLVFPPQLSRPTQVGMSICLRFIVRILLEIFPQEMLNFVGPQVYPDSAHCILSHQSIHWSVCLLVFFLHGDVPFWTPGLPVGVLCNHPCPSVVRQSVSPSVRSPSLNISETALRIFLIFCMKLVHHKGAKVTEPDF